MQNIFMFHLIRSKDICHLPNAYSMVTQILPFKKKINTEHYLEVNF